MNKRPLEMDCRLLIAECRLKIKNLPQVPRGTPGGGTPYGGKSRIHEGPSLRAGRLCAHGCAGVLGKVPRLARHADWRASSGRLRSHGYAGVLGGFTLIEVLVVIAVVAILLAILLPTLQRVRSQAKAAVCQANLHQWGLLFNTLAQNNEGRLRDRDSWDRCRTQQFAYYLDHFDFEEFCPMAARRTTSSGAGGTFLAWYCPKHPYRTGSYGLNAYTPAYDGGERIGQAPRVKTRWTSIYQKGGANAPIMLDSALWAGDPMPTDSPPQTEAQAATGPTIGSNSIRPFCIPRHGGFVNCLFMDWSIRKVSIKKLWTLEWYPGFDTHGPWTRAGSNDSIDWPAWMRRFKD